MDERELFFTEIRELRKEMNNGFNRMCDALEKHKDDNCQEFKFQSDKIESLSKHRDYLISGFKLTAILASTVLFIKSLLNI